MEDVARSISELDDLHHKNKEVKELKPEGELSSESLFDKKVHEWAEGSAFCSNIDKGNIIKELIRRINILETKLEGGTNEN